MGKLIFKLLCLLDKLISRRKPSMDVTITEDLIRED